jgi:hypothetical protein
MVSSFVLPDILRFHIFLAPGTRGTEEGTSCVF